MIQAGQDAKFDCLVEADPRLSDSIVVEWFREGKKLEVDMLPESYGTNDTVLVSPESGELSRFMIARNNSLYIRNPTVDDIGTYMCQFSTAIDEFSMEAMLYSEKDWNWLLILIIIIICVLILILCILCIVCVRKRSRRKGRYGVKDVADGKKANRY